MNYTLFIIGSCLAAGTAQAQESALQIDARTQTQLAHPTTIAPQQAVIEPAPVVKSSTATDAKPSLSIDELMTQPELFNRVMLSSINQARWDALARLLPHYAKLAGRDEVLLHYAQGLLAMHNGKAAQTVTLFREILLTHPEYTAVRVDLGYALMMTNRDESATYHFKESLADTKLSADRRAFIEYSLARLAARQSFTVSAGASYLYDTNVNNASTNPFVTIWGLKFMRDPETLPKTARGYQLSVDAAKEFRLHEQHKLRVGVSLLSKDYDLNAFDAQDARLDAGYMWNNGLTSAYAGAYSTWRVQDRQMSERDLGVRVAASHTLSPHWSINGMYDYQRGRFPNYHWLNGHVHSANLGVTYAIKPTMNLSFGVNGSLRTAERLSLARTETGSQLGFAQDLNNGISYNALVRYTRTRYEGEAAFFGGTRRDAEWAPQLTLAWRKLNFYGFIPRLTVAYAKHSSNTPLFEYKKWNSFVTLDKKF